MKAHAPLTARFSKSRSETEDGHGNGYGQLVFHVHVHVHLDFHGHGHEKLVEDMAQVPRCKDTGSATGYQV